MSLDIRRATTADEPQIVDLGPRVCANAARGFGVAFDACAWGEQVAAFLAQPDRRMFVATDGDRVVGVHAVIACPTMFSRRALVVRTATLWVAPAARGQGAARRLHEMAEAWARSIGAQHMFAGVPLDYAAHAELGDPAATPAAAEGFYRDSGYLPVETTLLKEVC